MNKATLFIEVNCVTGERRVHLIKFTRKPFPRQKNLIDENAFLTDTDTLPVLSPESPEPDLSEELRVLVGDGNREQEPRPGPSHRKD